MPEIGGIQETLRDALREVIDPEVGMNVVDLGLIYGIEVTEHRVDIVMTMTTPACPMGSYLTDRVRDVVRQSLSDTRNIEVELIWDPPWDPHMMSDRARSYFGWFDE
ncbi:MAG: metal-sulfur cluster assembly factor [Gammaproteobacteria bacterium]|nr:metal-sulfur cluster assembly factor [Gammaproteobacteria bacterium]